MYGKWVTVDLGEGIECRVYVLCTPSTPDEVLQRLALHTLKSRLPEKKTGVAAGMEAIGIISDYEYAQGRGRAFEAEQELKRLIKDFK